MKKLIWIEGDKKVNDENPIYYLELEGKPNTNLATVKLNSDGSWSIESGDDPFIFPRQTTVNEYKDEHSAKFKAVGLVAEIMLEFMNGIHAFYKEHQKTLDKQLKEARRGSK